MDGLSPWATIPERTSNDGATISSHQQPRSLDSSAALSSVSRPLPTHRLGLALSRTKQLSPSPSETHASQGDVPLHRVRLVLQCSHALDERRRNSPGGETAGFIGDVAGAKAVVGDAMIGR